MTTFTTVTQAEDALNRADLTSRTIDMMLATLNPIDLIERFNNAPGPLSQYVTLALAAGSRRTYRERELIDTTKSRTEVSLPEKMTIDHVGRVLGLNTRYYGSHFSVTATPTAPSVSLSQDLTRLYRLLLNNATLYAETEQIRKQYGVLAKASLKECDGLLVNARTSRRDTLGILRASRRASSSFQVIPVPLLDTYATYSHVTGRIEDRPAAELLVPEYRYFESGPSRFKFTIPLTKDGERFSVSTTELKVLGTHSMATAQMSALGEIIGHYNKARNAFEAENGAAQSVMVSYPTTWNEVQRAREGLIALHEHLFEFSTTTSRRHTSIVQVLPIWATVGPIIGAALDEKATMDAATAAMRGHLAAQGHDTDVIDTLMEIDDAAAHPDAAENYWAKYVADNDIPPVRL